VLRLRERVISLVRLRDALGLDDPLRNAGCGMRDGDDEPPGKPELQVRNPQSAIRNPHLYVLVMGLAEQRIGLVVDRIQGEGELVIKALDAEWASRAPIAGGAILGDGRVVLILDPGALIQRTLARGRASREVRP